VGSGFDEKTLASIWERLQPLRRATSPFDIDSPKGREHTWVEPKLVAEVRFTEWTREGGLRHPTFLGLRDDKKPEECRREEPIEIAALEADSAATATVATRPAVAPAPGAAGPMAVPADRTQRRKREIKLTNLDKVFWPDERYTKGDLIGFYEAVAPLLLPYLEDRPLVLTRYPDGITGKSFFQKDAPQYAAGYVRTVAVYSKESEREIKYFVVDDADMLRYVANLGTIPIHVWSARVGSLETPDWLVLDLDPKEAPFQHVVRVARTLHDLLDELRLPSFIKTSGATGLHVLLPMGRRYTHEETRTFARLLAMLVVEAVPDIATVTRAVQSREGKVYVDFGQNGHGNTIVAPYSVRPLPGAPASCPLSWDEVDDTLDPARFTIRTIPKRFATMPDPVVAVLAGSLDMGKAIQGIEKRLGGGKGRS
jgi:bifunctional non-homologous end joining protein LigD